MGTVKSFVTTELILVLVDQIRMLDAEFDDIDSRFGELISNDSWNTRDSSVCPKDRLEASWLGCPVYSFRDP